MGLGGVLGVSEEATKMDTESRVVLAEIRGDIKRIFDHMARYADDNRIVQERMTGHGNRIASLESNKVDATAIVAIGVRVTSLESERSERAGMGKALKLAYMVAGGTGGAVIATVAAMVLRAQGV